MQRTIVIGSAALIASVSTSVQPAQAGGGVALSGPPEAARAAYEYAYEACLDKEEGTECTLAFDGEALEGTCVLALDQRLLCLPDDAPAAR